MHYIGLDLAWGARKPTGVAVLAGDGTLLHVASVMSDADIRSVIQAYLLGPIVVGFDAPIIVKNPSGNRGAEAALNKDFAGFEAGAHPQIRRSLSSATGPERCELLKNWVLT
ncbi:DUF429 domain-containing protein [Ornithinimicrobium sp. INDO-MA30-4]|uniref:DUF429 domain-containing protein n=1 Tax=Ornithinimicrobium sp. INDO-MA30-4 TaxID=2908651 RepID=UPI002882F967|nr:DUF429 domain-containing protein [Ornithinimicrobium sp. INDO-MA30-4]